jgi:CheY-like chemotaxis protein
MVLPSRSALLVEDDAAVRRLYRSGLALDGWTVSEAADGMEALRFLETMSPDVVVLDLMLPGIDGVDVLAELAAHAQTRSIPVVVVTGTARNLDFPNVFCIMRKPVSPEEVVAAVRQCVEAQAPLTRMQAG